jgi:trimethyllysine dioxygenase
MVCLPTWLATFPLSHSAAGGFYDFTADLASGDTAYTQLGIGAHTDNTYFSDPAGLQMFHLLSHTDGEGGASQLVDGFGAADELLREDPESYAILSTVRINCHASGGKDSSIQPFQTFPVLVHDAEGVLAQVRWNTTDRATIDMPIEEVAKWYDAARQVFAKRISRYISNHFLGSGRTCFESASIGSS